MREAEACLQAGSSPVLPRVLIVAESASARFGGEAALPLHYFRVLRKRGVPVWLLTHARTRDELSALYPHDVAIRYVEDTALNRVLWRLGRHLPVRLSHFTLGFVSRLVTQLAQRRVARALVHSERIDVVHQPVPVSPREPSTLFDLGAPVVIGPMNGNMDYPPAFDRRRSGFESALMRLGRATTRLMNVLLPGKPKAALLLVANARTSAALPAGGRAPVVELAENGIDLGLWQQACSMPPPAFDAARPARFIYVGRLVDWKAVDLLLHAFGRAAARAPMRLDIVGDGDQRRTLEALAASLGLMDTGSAAVRFAGWQAQTVCADLLARSDALVLPSLLECGGAVVLEAMAMGKPVIATDWGGPADYLDASCGILVTPTGREAFIDGLRDALLRLASEPQTGAAMGARGLAKVCREYDWDAKVARMLELYAMARASHAAHAT
jgi:glycosyltransferase involved in cell wall biosynthesis